MQEVYAVLICSLLAGLTVFQLTLITGAPLGHYAWGGAHKILPLKLRIGSAISILLYGLFSMIILSKAGLISLLDNSTVINIGIWVLASYFILGILLNGISRSKPERNLMTPLVFILAVATILLALS